MNAKLKKTAAVAAILAMAFTFAAAASAQQMRELRKPVDSSSSTVTAGPGITIPIPPSPLQFAADVDRRISASVGRGAVVGTFSSDGGGNSSLVSGVCVVNNPDLYNKGINNLYISSEEYRLSRWNPSSPCAIGSAGMTVVVTGQGGND